MKNAPHGAFFGDDNSPSFAKERGTARFANSGKGTSRFSTKNHAEY